MKTRLPKTTRIETGHYRGEYLVALERARAEAEPMRVGDRVRLRGGIATGTVRLIQRGPWSNGGVPMVTVLWDARPPLTATYIGRHTQTGLEVVR